MMVLVLTTRNCAVKIFYFTRDSLEIELMCPRIVFSYTWHIKSLLIHVLAQRCELHMVVLRLSCVNIYSDRGSGY